MVISPERVERGSQRFRAADRIRDPRDYVRSRTNGRRASSSALTAELTWTGGRSRLGLVVSRKVGGAVTRNRVKRRVREWFRRHRADLPVGADLVVIARRQAAELATQALWRELAALVARGAHR
ncbi:MAG TPA: ribonuclease P protein component [Myxococcota bacterium]|nr:ribonuclease P protein component [Myxococcota bacterium]